MDIWIFDELKKLAQPGFISLSLLVNSSLENKIFKNCLQGWLSCSQKLKPQRFSLVPNVWDKEEAVKQPAVPPITLWNKFQNWASGLTLYINFGGAVRNEHILLISSDLMSFLSTL